MRKTQKGYAKPRNYMKVRDQGSAHYPVVVHAGRIRLLQTLQPISPMKMNNYNCPELMKLSLQTKPLTSGRGPLVGTSSHLEGWYRFVCR